MPSNTLCEGLIAPSQRLFYVPNRLIAQISRRGQNRASGAIFLGLFFLLICLQSQAEYRAPRITLSKKNAALSEVFKDIQKQTQYTFVYVIETMQQARRISIDVKDASLEEVLSLCFQNQPFTYLIQDKQIIVKIIEKKVVKIDTTQSPNMPSLLNVKGKVTDYQANPIGSATVQLKGTERLAITDSRGEFEMEGVAPNSILLISSVGFSPKEIRVSGNQPFVTQLKIAVNNLDETVVVAYNTTTRRANTGAVTVIKGDQITSIPNRSFDKSLQGLVPGLLVTSGTGQPGGGTANFVLRGITTGAAPNALTAVRNPLVVVDGVPVTDEVIRLGAGTSPATSNINPMAQLNPSDIESISILKDASAISLYGSKASNGVILITTKRGKAGKTSFNFRHQTDISTRLNGKSTLLNQKEYLEMLYQTYKNTDSVTWTDEAILANLKTKFPVRSDGSFYPEVDWAKEIFQKNALTVTNELSISGGTEKSNFYLSFEYSKQKGVVKQTSYDRKSLRFNFENKPTNWFKLGLNTTLSHNEQGYAVGSVSDFPVGLASVTSPLIPVRLEDGSYYWQFAALGNASNPVAANEFATRKNTAYRAVSSLIGTITPIKNIKITSLVGVDFMLIETREKWDPKLFDPEYLTSGNGRITEQSSRALNLISTNTVSYNNQFADHALQVLVGQEAQIQHQKLTLATGIGFPNGYIEQISSALTNLGSGSLFKQTLLSYLGQANYNYQNKYFFSSSIRRDGSSKFGKNQRFGTYWSTGLGWVLSEEKFLKEKLSWLDFLKIRGSIGAAGNSGSIDRTTRYDLLTSGWFLDPNNRAVFPGSTPGNQNIQPEETINLNAGLEMRFFKGRINLTTDIYRRRTSDVLYVINIPLSSGYYSVLDNIGNMENKGIELSFSSEIIRRKTFSWNFSFNWSSNKNKLLKADVPLASVAGELLANEEGRNFNSFYMPKWAGVDPATGNPQWLDAKGTPTQDYNAAQKMFVGKPQPDGFGSVINTFKFKNIQLSASFYYQYGYQVYIQNALNNDGLSPYRNQEKPALVAWKKPGDNALTPKRTLSNYMGYYISTRNLYNGDHIRLQNVQLSYSFPHKMISSIGFNSASIFFQGYNLAVWTGFSNDGDLNNVDIQGSGGIRAYPDAKSFSLGLNIGL